MNKRQKEVLQAQLNSEEEVIAQLKSVYEQALRDCEAKIQELSMRADLEPENIQSIVYQKQYQEAIKAQLEGALANLQSDSYATVSDYLTRSYQDGYLGSMYDMQGQGIPLVMPIDQEAVARAVLLDSQLSTSLYDRMGEDVKAIKKAVRQEVSRGIAQGMTWSNIASNLARNMKHTPFQKAYNNSIRIARTEGHRIQNRAALDAQKRAIDRGAEVVKQWNAVLDGRTRSEHRELDGQIREVDEMFEVAGYKAEAPGLFGDPSQDCNCRCCLDQRARWALNCGIVKMDNFSNEAVVFESPEEYAEWKKVYWSDENIAYMQHVTAMEKKYGKNFEKMLNSMTDKEYEKYKRLLDNNPMYTISGKHSIIGAKEGKGKNNVYYNSKNDYSINLEGLDQKVNSELSRVAERVAQLGSSDGCEHMYLVDLTGKGKSYYETNGDSGSVGYSFWEYANKHKDNQFAFVHNHNTDSSLSQTDLETPILCKNIPIQIAVTNDGVKYIARRKKMAPAGYYPDRYYSKELEKLNERSRNGEITPIERMNERERIIIECLIKEFYGGVEIIDGRE